MWERVGILRDAAGLGAATQSLDALRARLLSIGVASTDLRYNLTWHDWLNLESLIAVSQAVCAAALARTDSRGAHFREDHPESGDPAASSFSRVRLEGDRFAIDWKPVAFTRVHPGQSLVQ
jgi:fumarate reductase flavoprotein subunit